MSHYCRGNNRSIVPTARVVPAVTTSNPHNSSPKLGEVPARAEEYDISTTSAEAQRPGARFRPNRYKRKTIKTNFDCCCNLVSSPWFLVWASAAQQFIILFNFSAVRPIKILSVLASLREAVLSKLNGRGKKAPRLNLPRRPFYCWNMFWRLVVHAREVA